MDRWQSQPIICKGGLDLSKDVISQGTQDTGTALVLQNFEPALEGGYSRILGYTKFDPATVTGKSGTPVLGVFAALSNVFAARMNVGASGVDIFKSSGAGWSKINGGTPRSASGTKYRFLYEAILVPAIIIVDGYGYAAKYDGTTHSLINGTGAPADPKYAETFLNRLALAGYSAKPSAVSISAPNTDTDFNGADGAIEFIAGDVITGLKTFRDELYIFCQRSIWKLTGTTSDNFAIVSVSKNIGCVSADSIQEIGGDIIFLAPDGLRSVSGTVKIDDVDLGLLSQNISPIIRPYTMDLSPDNYSSCSVPSKSQYRLFLYQSALADASAVGFLGRFNNNLYQDYNIAQNIKTAYEWATLSGINAYCAAGAYDGNDEVVVFGHPTNGYVYRMERGNSFDGSSVQAVYRSPHLTFSDATIRKVNQKIDIYVKQDGAINVNLDLILDLGSLGIKQPLTTKIMNSGSFPVYDVAIYDTAVYAVEAFPVYKTDIVGGAFTTAFQFSSNDTNPPYRIDSYVVQFSPKGRR